MGALVVLKCELTRCRNGVGPLCSGQLKGPVKFRMKHRTSLVNIVTAFRSRCRVCAGGKMKSGRVISLRFMSVGT